MSTGRADDRDNDVGASSAPGDPRPLVHIVDDEAGMRAFISFALQRAGYATEIYGSGGEFLEALNRHPGEGCVLLDYRMPQMNDLEVLSEIASQGFGVAPVMMTGHGDIATAVSAMKSGAVDFIEKPFRVKSLLETVSQAMSIQQKEQASAGQARVARLAIESLAPREREVVQGLLAGMSNKMIAKRLDLSPRTVEDHRFRAMRKLGADSVADVIRTAIGAGLEPLADRDPPAVD